MKGASPYKKYNKKPRRYSTLYNEWKSARKAGKEQEVQRLATAHTKYWLNPKEEVQWLKAMERIVNPNEEVQ